MSFLCPWRSRVWDLVGSGKGVDFVFEEDLRGGSRYVSRELFDNCINSFINISWGSNGKILSERWEGYMAVPV